MFGRTVSAIVLASCILVAGCGSIGNAPEGPDQEQVKRNFDALPTEKKIAFIENSPLPKAEKDKRIAEIKGQQK